MPALRLAILLAALGGAGCESKKAADLRVRNAYLSGEQAASQQMLLQAPPPQLGQAPAQPLVYVRGNVRNSTVPWSEDLTLARAIVDADYVGFMNPVSVRVLRNGATVVEMKGVDLLHGQDAPLQPGDVVDLSR